MGPTTLSGIIRPATRGAARLYDAALTIGASALIALSAQISLRLPFTPVPVTFQTLAVLLVGAALGSRRGALAVALLVAEGAAGFPVFAGWQGGITYLLGPTGGYLIGFVPAAFITGLLAERGWDRKPLGAAAAMLLGTLVIYAAGAAWLAAFVGAGRVLALGVLPFIPGDLVKVALATGVLPLAWRVTRRERGKAESDR